MGTKRIGIIVLFYVACTFATSLCVFGKDKDTQERYYYLLKFKENLSLDEEGRIFKDYGIEVETKYKQIGVLHVSHNDLKQVDKFKSDKKELLQFFEDDHKVRAIASPNDPFFPEQSSLERIDIEKAWDMTTGSYDIVVAVSDTGINFNHGDLVNQIWTNFDEIPRNGRDDDGNGFIDDVSGWNFVDKNSRPVDDNGHGSHVSGIIGAQGNNMEGLTGINWKIQIMPLKFLNNDGEGRISGGIATILYAADNGARVLNASWSGKEKSFALKEAIDYAFSKGMLVIAAAGNDSENNDNAPTFPASTESQGVIAVASSQQNGSLSSFSNFGYSVSLAAPGSNVFSTYLDDGYKRLSGTSMAAPMVTGVAALMVNKKRELKGLELRNAILNGVIFNAGYQGFLLTSGELNAEKSLSQINEEFQIWPKKIYLRDGEKFQFSAVNGRGKVKWEVRTSEKNLAQIDDNGILTITKDEEGVLKVVANDEQGNSSISDEITIVALSGGNRGGGCTKEAYAGTPGSAGGSGVSTVMGYALFLLLVIGIKRMKKILIH